MSVNMPNRLSAREEGPAERTTVTLPPALAKRLRAEARGTGRSVSSIVREALEAHFRRKKAPRLPSSTGVGASGRHDISERVEELVAELIWEEHHR